jgi:hypothetical protein
VIGAQERRDLTQRAAASPLIAPPTAFAEEFDAAWRVVRDAASSDSEHRNRYEFVQEQLDRFADETGEVLRNPEGARVGPGERRLRPPTVEYDEVRRRFDAWRQANPGTTLRFPSEEEIAAAALETARASVDAAGRTASRPRTTAGFLGNLAGSAAGFSVDPISLMTMAFGGLGARTVLAVAAREAGIAAGTQIAITALNYDYRSAADPNFGPGTAIAEVGFAAAGGAVLGGAIAGLAQGAAKGAGALRARRGRTRAEADAEAVIQRETEIDASSPFPRDDPEATAAHRAALDRATQDVAAGRPEAVIAAERARLGQAYDSVLASPQGPAKEPAVTLTPEQMEAVIVERGGWKGHGDVTVKGRGWGIAKIIWGHGEQSRTAAAWQVTRDDVLALPTVLRDFEPSAVILDAGGSPVKWEWRIQRGANPEGSPREVVYAVSRFSEAGGDNKLVSIYVREPGRSGAGGQPSKPREPQATSPGPVISGAGDTPVGSFDPPAGGGASELAPAPPAGNRNLPASQEQGAPTSTRSPRAAEFAEVIVHRGPESDIRMTRPKARFEAAKAGDVSAAVEIVGRVVDSAVVARIAQAVADAADVRVVPVHAGEGRNMVPMAYARHLARAIGGEVEPGIIQVTTAKRRGAGWQKRIAGAVEFDGPVTPGAAYILVDDHITMGSTLADLAGYIEGRGGTVRLASALTSTDPAPHLAATQETLAKLRARLGAAEEWFRAFRGFGFEGLTDAEAARLLKSVRTPDALRKELSAARAAGSAGGDGPAAPDGAGPEPAGGGGAGRVEEDRRAVVRPDDAEEAARLAGGPEVDAALLAEAASVLAARDIDIDLDGGVRMSGRQLLAEADAEVAAAAEISACAAATAI